MSSRTLVRSLLGALCLALSACGSAGKPSLPGDLVGGGLIWIFETLGGAKAEADGQIAGLNPAFASDALATAHQDCDAIDPGGARSARRKALLLGRLTSCYERSGRRGEAIELREQQRQLHRKFGSVLFPAEYYRVAMSDQHIRTVEADEPVSDCVVPLGPATATACSSCTAGIALRNRCSVAVYFAYCRPLDVAADSDPACHPFHSPESGEVFVVPQGAGFPLKELRSFRTASERARWINRNGGS